MDISSNKRALYYITVFILSISKLAKASHAEEVNIITTELVEPVPPQQKDDVVDPQNPIEDHLEITQVPRQLQHDLPVHLQYRCTQPSLVHVALQVSTEFQENVTVFRYRTRCGPEVGVGPSRIAGDPGGIGPAGSPADIRNVTKSVVRILLPRYIAYRPSHYNRYSVFIDRSMLRIWMTRIDSSQEFRDSLFPHVTHEISLSITPPYSRPPRPVTSCPTWWKELQTMKPYRPVCPADTELFKAITFPMASAGGRTGVHREVSGFKYRPLQEHQNRTVTDPRYTLVFWLHVTEYCPTGICSIMQHMTWDDRYATPLIFLNQRGQVHVEVILENGESRAYLSPESFIIPTNQWSKLTVSCHKRDLNVTLHYGQNLEKREFYGILLREDDVQYFDDRIGNFVFGGTELQPAFRGYIGQAWLYRRQAVDPDLIPNPDASHPMYKLALKENEKLCSEYRNYVSQISDHYQDLLDAIVSKKRCPNVIENTLYSSSLKSHPVCSRLRRLPRRTKNSTHLSVIDSLRPWIRRAIFDGKHLQNAEFGARLLLEATILIDKSVLQNVQSIINILKAASCLESHNATFILSVILNYGIGIKSNELEARSYLIRCAERGNRLCLLGLGNKHAFGLDGFPFDLEQSYVYYKTIADMTKVDRDTHQPDGVYTELVRLTNENQINEQTEETGDLFMWFKFQANQGVFHAQQHLARMLYWGAHGVHRNVEAAVEYYRLGAETGDPDALYDYGIVLIKGHGVEKNITLGIEQMEKAAQFDHPRAINALGWYYLEIELDYTKAAEFFERANALGNKDAAHNLAHMYLRGYYPGSGVDRVKAWEYISSGAIKSQLDCAVLVAMYNIRGHPSITRNPDLAVTWARFVAEQNPAVGQILNSGFRNYRRRNWMSAVFYYLLAASTGVEVANFNLAYLLDESLDVLSPSIEKECKWRHYNLSTLRPQDYVDPYALIKMADYHFDGVAGSKDSQKAEDLYCSAALLGAPQGIFNLAYMVEEGVHVRSSTWDRLGVPQSVTETNYTLLTYLYSRCKESHNEEAFLPCSLALYRVYWFYVWTNYNLLIQILFTITLTTVLSTAIIASMRRMGVSQPQVQTDTSTDTSSETEIVEES